MYEYSRNKRGCWEWRYILLLLNHCQKTIKSKTNWALKSVIPNYSPWHVSHTLHNNTRAYRVWWGGDISNMKDAGISLERSAATGEGQRELSFQCCMQQAVKYHITAKPHNITITFVNKYLECKKNLMQNHSAKWLKYLMWLQYDLFDEQHTGTMNRLLLRLDLTRVKKQLI